MLKRTVTVIVTLLAILIFSPLALADYKYVIQDETTKENLIDTDNTNVVIDTESMVGAETGHIRLPRGNPSGISFLGEDSFDVVVLTANGIEKISPDGTSKTIIELDKISNPTAVFAGGIFPDVVVAEDDAENEEYMKITHYSHLGGDEYAINSDLTIMGLSKTIAVSTSNLDKATIGEDGVFQYHHWTGEEYSDGDLSLNVSNPISMALLGDSYSAVVVTSDGVEYISSLSSIKTILSDSYSGIAASGADSFAVVGDGGAEHYHIVDGSAHKNEYLTVKEGLDAPSAIALRPGSFDRAIVDGDVIKFYLWTGEELALAGEVEFDVLDGIGKYISKARLSSKILTVEGKNDDNLAITHVRLKCGLIDTFEGVTSKYQIEWYVTTDKDLMKSGDDLDKANFSDLSKWKRINTTDDWYALDEPAEEVRYMVVLKTFDRDYTPRIHEFVEIELRVELQAPDLQLPTGPYYTSNPEIWWEFDDSGIEEAKQSAFQVVVFNSVDKEILNTGKVLSSQESYVIRNTDMHESLWGEQDNQFKVQVKVWDDAGNESPFTPKGNFNVLAFDRPVITEIISPPMKGREWVNRFTESMTLPIAKAGTAVTFRIHGIGVGELKEADIYYPGSRSLDKNNGWNIVAGLQPIDVRDRVEYLKEFEVVVGYESSTNKVWEATFYSDADTDVCPNGTVIAGMFYADNLEKPLLIMDDVYNYNNRETPANGDGWTNWDGYRWWAEGITITNDTVLSDWIVVLRAKD